MGLFDAFAKPGSGQPGATPVEIVGGGAKIPPLKDATPPQPEGTPIPDLKPKPKPGVPLGDPLPPLQMPVDGTPGGGELKLAPKPSPGGKIGDLLEFADPPAKIKLPIKFITGPVIGAIAEVLLNDTPTANEDEILEQMKKSQEKPGVPTPTAGQCLAEYYCEGCIYYASEPSVCYPWNPFRAFGAIGAFRLISNAAGGDVLQVFHHGSAAPTPKYNPNGEWGTIYDPGNATKLVGGAFTKIERVDGQADNCGGKPSPSEFLAPPSIPGILPYPEIPGTAPSDPSLLNNPQPISIQPVPGQAPISISVPGADPFVITPGGDPNFIGIPLSETPNPGSVSLNIGSPGGSPTTLVTPGAGPVTIQIPGMEPITINPSNPQDQPSGTGVTPNPLIFSPTPQPETEEKPSPIPDLNTIGLGIITINQLVEAIKNNTTPEAIKNAAAEGTCSTIKPGGCLEPLNKNAEDAAKKSGEINDLLNAINTGLLIPMMNGINTLIARVGAQIPGGLSGGLTRMSSWLGIGRIFDLINFAANLHNALMLSNSLKVTLLEMLSSLGNATGLLQTSENENVDLNIVFNNGVEGLMKLILGEDNYAGLKTAWRKYNRIYQAATNSLNAISSMFNSIGNVIELTAEHTGKIGNSLTRFGVIAENAYGKMNEKINAKMSKFINFENKVGNTIEVL